MKDFLNEYVLAPIFVILFYLVIYIDRFLNVVKKQYYDVRGIDYILMNDKFGKYPKRLSK